MGKVSCGVRCEVGRGRCGRRVSAPSPEGIARRPAAAARPAVVDRDRRGRRADEPRVDRQPLAGGGLLHGGLELLGQAQVDARRGALLAVGRREQRRRRRRAPGRRASSTGAGDRTSSGSPARRRSSTDPGASSRVSSSAAADSASSSVSRTADSSGAVRRWASARASSPPASAATSQLVAEVLDIGRQVHGASMASVWCHCKRRVAQSVARVCTAAAAPRFRAGPHARAPPSAPLRVPVACLPTKRAWPAALPPRSLLVALLVAVLLGAAAGPGAAAAGAQEPAAATEPPRASQFLVTPARLRTTGGTLTVHFRIEAATAVRVGLALTRRGARRPALRLSSDGSPPVARTPVPRGSRPAA